MVIFPVGKICFTTIKRKIIFKCLAYIALTYMYVARTLTEIIFGNTWVSNGQFKVFRLHNFFFYTKIKIFCTLEKFVLLIDYFEFWNV